MVENDKNLASTKLPEDNAKDQMETKIPKDVSLTDTLEAKPNQRRVDGPVNQRKRKNKVAQQSLVSEDNDSVEMPNDADQKKFGKGRKGNQAKKVKRWRSMAEASLLELAAVKAELEQRPSFPLANRAKMKRRHWGLIFSFLLLVIAPLVLAGYYMYAIAKDQYLSTTGFTVRTQESSGANDLLGGLATFAGGTTASDSDILYEYIQSQEMVETVDREVDLKAHYTQYWDEDPVFSLKPEAVLEDLVSYWGRIVGISYDTGSGLIEVEAAAFDAVTAQKVTQTILDASQTRINVLNQQAREDAMRYANIDLDDAVEQLKTARQAITQFRTRTRIVDPTSDIQSRLGVMSNLQQQLAEALISADLLLATFGDGDLRLQAERQKIAVIRQRIDIERQTFASSNTDTGAVGEDYPTLISEFERLTVDLQYAEETYRAALTALATARDDASRQNRYLATYIRPTKAQASEYPQREIAVGLIGLFLLLVWSIFALIYYSIRDRS